MKVSRSETAFQVVARPKDCFVDKELSKEELEEQLRALADVTIDAYLDFRKRGLIDKKGNFVDKVSSTPQQKTEG